MFNTTALQPLEAEKTQQQARDTHYPSATGRDTRAPQEIARLFTLCLVKLPYLTCASLSPLGPGGQKPCRVLATSLGTASAEGGVRPGAPLGGHGQARGMHRQGQLTARYRTSLHSTRP